MSKKVILKRWCCSLPIGKDDEIEDINICKINNRCLEKDRRDRDCRPVRITIEEVKDDRQ